MNKSKVAIAVSKTISFVQMLFGIAYVFIFGICTIVCLCDKDFLADGGVSVIIVCLIFDVLGIWLIILSLKKTKLLKEFKKYVTVISREPDGYIPDIAASLGVSEDIVKKNLELMIKKRYFANAFIDQNSNCIVITSKQNNTVNTTHQSHIHTTEYASSPVTSQAIEMMTIKCKGCGGINTIQKGAIGECDYCGSSIKGE